MWRGFDHPEPVAESEEDLKVRDRMVSQPHIDRSLHTLIVTTEGDYCAYCGIWYDVSTSYAVIEPVVTHPDYRQRGLGRAAVLAAVNKCADMGAQHVYVGSSQQFYYQLGFRPLPASTFWRRK
jgi:N-acetylglutamate synthase-like GNAT family acetyltransferase